MATEGGEVAAELEPRLRKEAPSAAHLPCVGDWVALNRPASLGSVGMIRELLSRMNKFSRKAAGLEHSEQVLAANVDTIFIAMGLDGDFNVRRLERYLTVAWACGGQPVVLLTKMDLCSPQQLAARAAEVQAIAPNVPIVPISVVSEPEVLAVDQFLGRGQTVALLGSSGVGKSTLVNALLKQDLLRTNEVRASDSRGRHTTTQRQLFRVRGGALVIDTPGIRELQLWDAEAGFQASFAEIDGLAAACRFRDCRHRDEPGCAVAAALARGEVSAERIASYEKLKSEQAGSPDRGQEARAARQRKRAAASVTKLVRRKYQSE